MIDFYQVWHNDEWKDKIAPSAKYLKLEDWQFPKLSNGLDVQEYRMWQIPNDYFDSNNQIIGFASARWHDKFPDAPGIQWLLHSIRSMPPKDRFMHSFVAAQPHWIEHMNFFHRGMLQYILEGAGALGVTPEQLNNPYLPMCNSFACRKDVFFELKDKMNFLFNYYEQKYQNNFQMADNGYGSRVLGCFYERVLMVCTASLKDVRFGQPMIYWNW